MQLEFLLGGLLGGSLAFGHGLYIFEMFILPRTPAEPLPESPFGDGVISKAISRVSVHTLTFDFLAGGVALVMLAFLPPSEASRWLARFIAIHFAAYAVLFLGVVSFDMYHLRWMNPLRPSEFRRVHRQARAGRGAEALRERGWFPAALVPPIAMLITAALAWYGAETL